MDERLSSIRVKVSGVRRALEELRRRLAALRERLRESEAPASPQPADNARAPLFQPPLPLDDRELHFEALDTEDPKRGER